MPRKTHFRSTVDHKLTPSFFGNKKRREPEDNDSISLEYIDFIMGWCVGNIGWGQEEIKRAIRNSKAPVSVLPGLVYKPWDELVELLASISPGQLKCCYRTTGENEAVEGALQIARQVTNRSKFMFVEGSYHGNSISALSNGFKIKRPLDAKAAKNLEKYLKQKDIAAFIMEPVICNSGVFLPDQEFMNILQDLCKHYGTLLVMDEVATGFGRTGKIFASEHFGIEPDIMIIAKAISGGYGTLGAIMTTEKIARSIKAKFSNSTDVWHPLSVDAALANLKFIIKHEKTLLQNVEETSDRFRQRISHMQFKNGSKLSLSGLAIGIDVGDEFYADNIKKKCRMSGLLLGAEDKSLLIYPPLNIEKTTADKGMDILASCL